MKILDVLKESTVIAEGGHGVSGVGPIHIEELEPTLAYLEKKLGFPLIDNALGSTGKDDRTGKVGKKEFMGDIDVAVDVPAEQVGELLERIKSMPEFLEVNKGSVIMTKVKIQNYDAKRTNSKGQVPEGRTGFVQLDFMPGDPAWMKTYYHSPSSSDSKYKGAHRNALLATIAMYYDAKRSEETLDDGRPLEWERWMWGSNNGLTRIIRRPKPKSKGEGYTKSSFNEIIAGPWRTADEIAKKLNLGSGEALYSFETLMAAIEQNYPPELVKQIAKHYANDTNVSGIGVPDELKHLVDESQQVNEILPAIAGAVAGAAARSLGAGAIGRGIASVAGRTAATSMLNSNNKDLDEGIRDTFVSVISSLGVSKAVKHQYAMALRDMAQMVKQRGMTPNQAARTLEEVYEGVSVMELLNMYKKVAH